MMTYRLDAGDLKRAGQRHYRSNMLKSVAIWLALSGVIVLLFALGVLGDARRSLTIVLLPIVLVTVVVTHMAMYFIAIPYSSRKQYAMHRRLHLLQECEFDDAGLRFKNELGQNLVPWDHIHKLAENEDHFLLYPTKSMYYILPKRAFSHDSEIDRLRRLLVKVTDGAKPTTSTS
jgi:hypothetical protein